MVCQKTEQCCGHTLLGLAPGQQRTHLNMLYPPPITDANAFQDISTFQQYHPFADFASTALTHQKGVTGLTHDDKSCTWARWEEYFLAARCQESSWKKESSCLKHLSWLSGVGDSLIRNSTHWLKPQAEVSYQMWYRPSGHWGDKIPQEMQTVSYASFYQDSSEPSETKTLQRNNKRPFHSQSSTN